MRGLFDNRTNINLLVKDPLSTAWVMLYECISNNVQISKEQFNILSQLCLDVKRKGNLEQKQQFCYILYWARANSNNTNNFNLCINIEKYFRELCAPWLNKEDSFKKIKLDFLNDLKAENSKMLSMQA